jgi:hypothetical protein
MTRCSSRAVTTCGASTQTARPRLIGAIGAPSPTNAVIMAATSNIGTTPAYLFVAGGGPLMLYMENGYARGTVGGSPVANNDVIQIGGVYYKFTNAGVNVGAPAGTNANPWLVALGVSDATAWTNFCRCRRQQRHRGNAI